MALPDDARRIAGQAQDGKIVFLTGAGISAESGIPTFRGEEGYWVVGSRNYHPQEMATKETFRRMPDEVWSWYLYRRGVCRAAKPNPSHVALAEFDARNPERFLLITQNVDGLHLRAGSPLERTYQIHGNIDYMRCADGCSAALYEMPEGIDMDWPKHRRVGDRERALLRCPRCGGISRPHVLWFDETYNEEHFRFHSSLEAAVSCDLLVVVGTAGQTNLPMQVGAQAARNGAAILVVNLEPNPFTEFAGRAESGAFLQGRAGDIVPELCQVLG